jgi:hypothetical protein
MVIHHILALAISNAFVEMLRQRDHDRAGVLRIYACYLYGNSVARRLDREMLYPCPVYNLRSVGLNFTYPID